MRSSRACESRSSPGGCWRLGWASRLPADPRMLAEIRRPSAACEEEGGRTAQESTKPAPEHALGAGRSLESRGTTRISGAFTPPTSRERSRGNATLVEHKAHTAQGRAHSMPCPLVTAGCRQVLQAALVARCSSRVAVGRTHGAQPEGGFRATPVAGLAPGPSSLRSAPRVLIPRDEAYCDVSSIRARSDGVKTPGAPQTGRAQRAGNCCDVSAVAPAMGPSSTSRRGRGRRPWRHCRLPR
jgi:hypothetical protein